MKLSNIKITILRRTINRDLVDEYVVDEYKGISQCEKFKDNQEFIFDPSTAAVPEGFCDWAWADIRNEIYLIASGGNSMGMKEEGVSIAFCSDWARPVYFKIERID